MIRSAAFVGVAAVGLLAVALIGPGTAGAAVVSGSNLEAKPNSSMCFYVMPTSCTLTVSAIPPALREAGGTRAGISGVIVGWKLRTGAWPAAATARLSVVHGNRGAGTGPVETIPNTVGIHSYHARVPVLAGDQFGLDLVEVTGSSSPVMISETTEASVAVWKPPLGEGEERSPEGESADSEMLMNVTIEPDADHDGFGDESQDRCAGVSGSIDGCPAAGPAPPAPTPPNTLITKGPKGKIGGDRASFKFKSEPAGTAFECKLDKKKFKPCRSPKAYKGLAAGKHTFKVRAVSASGAIDPSPAKRSFRVEH